MYDSSSSSQLVVDGNRWNISTNYHTAGVSVWLAHLHDEFFIESFPMYEQLAALILVFDTTELSSLSALQKWVSQTDLQKFDILVCLVNKVDRVPGHPVHAEYRRRLQKLGDPFADAGPGFTAYGISETEGSSLLGDDEPFWEARHTCLEWCTERNIEFVEACASNADFDKCKFVVLYEARANTGIDRMKIINAVAKFVPAPHKVDLNNPNKTIVVEICRTICMIGVVDKYKQLAKYNLRQLTSSKP